MSDNAPMLGSGQVHMAHRRMSLKRGSLSVGGGGRWEPARRDQQRLLQRLQTDCRLQRVLSGEFIDTEESPDHASRASSLGPQPSIGKPAWLSMEVEEEEPDPPVGTPPDSVTGSPTVVVAEHEPRRSLSHYLEGLAPGLVDHLEGKRRSGRMRSQISVATSVLALVALSILVCVDDYGLGALPAWAEGPAAAARAGVLLAATRFGGPLALTLVKMQGLQSHYAVLLEGLLPYIEGFATGLLCRVLRLHAVADPLWAERLEGGAVGLMAASVLTAGRWLVECLYSTRLLKLRCGAQVLRNAWERAVIDRLRKGSVSQKDPGAPVPALSAGAGIWEFELQCAELLRLHQSGHAAENERSDMDQRAQASALFQKVVDRRLASPIRRPSMPSTPMAPLSPKAEGLSSQDGSPRCEERALLLEDLLACLPKADAERAWAWLWGDGDGGAGAWLWREDGEASGIDEEAFVQRVMETTSEARDLVSSICEYNTIFALFHSVVQCFYVAAMVSLGLGIFWPGALSALWWTCSSGLLALSFVFGPLIRDAFESLALILVVRPYDVGDRVVFADQRLLVVELNVLTTTFVNGSQELVWIRNSQIFGDRAGVRNLSRSEHAECGVELDLLTEDCTAPNIRYLEAAVRKWCESKPKVWLVEQCGDATAPTVGVSGMICSTGDAGPGVMRWRFRAVHVQNLHRPLQVKVDTSRLLIALIEACQARGIRLRRPPQDIVQREE